VFSSDEHRVTGGWVEGKRAPPCSPASKPTHSTQRPLHVKLPSVLAHSLENMQERVIFRNARGSASVWNIQGTFREHGGAR
jgi:hypothetical protein